MNNITPVVKNLIFINVIFFIATLIFKAQGINLSDILGVYYFASPKFQVWQPITYMFMHSDTDYYHILFNMLGLFMFGSTVEAYLGPKKFINFYLITGLGAVVLTWAVQAVELYQVTGSIVDNGKASLELLAQGKFNSEVLTHNEASTLYGTFFGKMVGASGALFGVMIAFGMLFPNLEMMVIPIPFPIKAKILIPIYILIELKLGVVKMEGDTVAHFAHLGGALIGFILIKYWRRNNYI
jgi:membrane associated rhomboid family serine protease